MLKIYHVPGTRSVRPVWLAFELELEVEVVFIDFSLEYRASSEWTAISPARKVPALLDDQATGDAADGVERLTMFESGAIVNYLLERYAQGRLHPAPGSAASAQFHQWCWFAEATLTRPLGLHRILRASDQAIDVLVDEGVEKAGIALAAVEQALEGAQFLVADTFSAADVMMGYSVGMLERLLTPEHPNLTAYLSRLREREAYQRVVGLKA